MSKQKHETSFKNWWKLKRKKLKQGGFQDWLIKTMEHIAREAWNESKLTVKKEILEVNVVIDRKTYQFLQQNNENNKDSEWNEQ